MGSFSPMKLAWLATDFTVAGTAVLVMNEFLGWNLDLENLGVLAGIAGAGITLVWIPAWWKRSERFGPGRMLVPAWLLAVVALWLFSRSFSQPVSLGSLIYLSGATAGLGLIFRLLHRVLSTGEGDWPEYLRLASLGVGATWLFYPYFTSELMGGIDARWYGFVMMDALTQVRAGIFPVLIGQGEFMYNGAVHPYLTAPYYHNLGIAIDWMTGRIFTPLLIQHLVVIVTAILAALVCYVCLALLAPRRRWLAWMLALLYVSGPVTLLYIYASEMYMTFTALAWLPLVIYGNVRLIQRNDRAGVHCLAVGLSLVCVCHAPVGMWAGMFTAAVQGLRLFARDFDFASWRRATFGGLLLCGLLAGYLVSVSELTPGGKANFKAFVHLLGLGAGLIALVRMMVSTHRGWLGLGLVSLVILWRIHPPQGLWLAFAFLIIFLFTRATRWLPAPQSRGFLPECLAVVLLASGIAAMMIVGDPDSGRAHVNREAVNFVLMQFPQRFLPITADATHLGDLQPGYAALMLLAVGVAVAVWKRSWELRILSLIGGLLFCMLAPVWGINAFLYTVVPSPVYDICSVGLWLRFLPLLAAIAIFVGGLAVFRFTEDGTRWWRRGLAGGMLGAALFWSGREAQKPIERGVRSVHPPATTATFYRTDSAPLYYAYDRLPRPGYLLNGVADYHLESRLLSLKDYAWLPDPLLSAPAGKATVFTTRSNPVEPKHLHLEPKVQVPPNDYLLLLFEFFDRPYDGYLSIRNSEFSRIYTLPDSGFQEKSFGVAPARPKFISIWNTRSQPQESELIFVANAASESPKPFGDFARIHLQRYKPEDLQIKTRSLIPYRADVSLMEPAFLETPRVFIPGYYARVNGRPAKVEASPDYLAMVRLEPGNNQVEIVFRGTIAARLFFWVSALVWLAELINGGWHLRRWLAARAAPC